jgi:hypothetical protein
MREASSDWPRVLITTTPRPCWEHCGLGKCWTSAASSAARSLRLRRATRHCRRSAPRLLLECGQANRRKYATPRFVERAVEILAGPSCWHRRAASLELYHQPSERRQYAGTPKLHRGTVCKILLCDQSLPKIRRTKTWLSFEFPPWRIMHVRRCYHIRCACARRGYSCTQAESSFRLGGS